MESTLEAYLEHIRVEFTTEGTADFRLAREEFHNLTGQFSDGEPWFELRMHMFMDWYLLERPGTNGLSPVETYLTDHFFGLSEQERHQLEQLAVSARSVFRIVSIAGDLLELDDVIFGGKWRSRITIPGIGLGKGDLLSARIVLFDDEPVIGRGVVLHPKEAHEAIFAIISRARREKMPGRVLIDYIDKMRLKYDRYSNVKIKHVYKYPTDVVF